MQSKVSLLIASIHFKHKYSVLKPVFKFNNNKLYSFIIIILFYFIFLFFKIIYLFSINKLKLFYN